jgi:LCP family protein required for cell wall assembly
VLLITLAALAVVTVTVVVILINTAKPPDIPQATPAAPHELSHENDATPEPGPAAPEDVTVSGRKDLFYTFLIFGIDDGVSTDTIMVASYDGVAREANVISIPRDSMVNVGRSVKKINGAYPIGTLNGGGRAGGIEQLKQEVSTIIGFTPDFYICVNLRAFVRIINALGGLEIDVPMRMRYEDPYQDLSIDIQKGLQTLNGENALKFARYRQGSDGGKTITDYQRIENQQTVIKAALDKLLKPANILKIPEFIGIFTDNVYTDLTAEDMLWFASEISNIKGTEALSVYTMPTTGNSGAPMWYEYLDGPAIVELLNETINPYNRPIQLKDLEIVGG